MASVRRTTRLVLAGALLFGAAWLGLLARGPGRNVSGLAAAEDLRAACVVPGAGATVRLYRGSGGAAGPEWYSVTVQHAGRREWQFFTTGRGPRLAGLRCRPGGVDVGTDRGPRPFSLAEIDTAYVPRPLLIVHRTEARRLARPAADLARPPGADPRAAGGAGLLALGGLLVAFGAGRQRAAAT